MESLTRNCNLLDIQTIDVYGDFDSTARDDEEDDDDGGGGSYLRSFEAEVAASLGKEDGVFMPSGVMAQSIALLIHNDSLRRSIGRRGDGGEEEDRAADERNCSPSDGTRGRFACHHSSHLILHENEGYRHLLSMEPLILSTQTRVYKEDIPIGVPPLTYSDVQQALEDGDESPGTTGLSTLMIELPHRELGGKLTPWEDVLKMKSLCWERGIRFHCDGARLFEASAGYE